MFASDLSVIKPTSRRDVELRVTTPRFCFIIFCITVGPAFAFSDFDVAGGLGFAFDVFATHCLFLRHRAF